MTTWKETAICKMFIVYMRLNCYENILFLLYTPTVSYDTPLLPLTCCMRVLHYVLHELPTWFASDSNNVPSLQSVMNLLKILFRLSTKTTWSSSLVCTFIEYDILAKQFFL